MAKKFTIEDVKNFIETNCEDGIKLLSTEYVNVADICLMFGGGGHAKAAGCNIQMPLEQAKEKIIAKVKEYIK